MKKEIELFDFVVEAENQDVYLFVSEIDNDTATIVGMDLNVTKDSIIFYAKKVNINSIVRTSEHFINLIGPLYKLRSSMKNGFSPYYIEERDAV